MSVSNVIGKILGLESPAVKKLAMQILLGSRRAIAEAAVDLSTAEFDAVANAMSPAFDFSKIAFGREWSAMRKSEWLAERVHGKDMEIILSVMCGIELTKSMITRNGIAAMVFIKSGVSIFEPDVKAFYDTAEKHMEAALAEARKEDADGMPFEFPEYISYLGSIGEEKDEAQ